MMSEFSSLESQDGVRMPWNIFPGTKQDSNSSIIPLSIFYTPLKPLNNIPTLPYSPLRCRSCRSILNPFAIVDFQAKIWICPFCYNRNHFPNQYAQIKEDNLPAELLTSYTTVEYEPPPEMVAAQMKSVYLFVIDCCLVEEEMEWLRSAVKQAVELVEEEARVGVITFGGLVQVHEVGGVGGTGVPRCYVFRGGKEVRKEQVVEQLGLYDNKARTGAVGGVRDGVAEESVKRFLGTVAECEFHLNAVGELVGI